MHKIGACLTLPPRAWVAESIYHSPFFTKQEWVVLWSPCPERDKPYITTFKKVNIIFDFWIFEIFYVLTWVRYHHWIYFVFILLAVLHTRISLLASHSKTSTEFNLLNYLCNWLISIYVSAGISIVPEFHKTSWQCHLCGLQSYKLSIL